MRRRRANVARDILGFATIEGARACRLDHKIGSVAVGKQADLVLLDLGRINVAPVNDPVGSLVQSADTSNVSWVFVAGAAVKRDGSLIERGAARALALAQKSREYLYSAAGKTFVDPSCP